MLAIRHINNVYDLFSGVGYDFHTRVQLVKLENGSIMARFLEGQRLPNVVIKQVVNILNPKLHYQNLVITDQPKETQNV